MRRSVSGTLTGASKAAALLATVGESASAQILKHLNEEEVQRVSQAVAQLTRVDSSEAEAILEEFHQMVAAQQYVVKGGIDYVREMLHHAFGAEVASRLLDQVKNLIANEAANFDVLQKADPQQLAKFIHNEHPQTI